MQVTFLFLLVDRHMTQTEMKLPEFLTTDLKGKVMTEIKLRPLSRNYELVTYKVRPNDLYEICNKNVYARFRTHCIIDLLVHILSF